MGRNYFSKNNIGFTLIELLVAIAIIGVLASSLFFVFNPAEQFMKGRDAQRKNDLEQMRNALDIYYNDNNRYPSQIDSKIEGIAWGSRWPSYIAKLPKDSLNTQSYYYEAANDGSWYRLCAKLERCSDPQIIPGIDCAASSCNYSVTSTNTSIFAFITPIPTPTPIPPTNTPVPPTPTPTPTPTSCSPNTWTKKADFGGEARSSAVGFFIDTKGYVGTGDDGGGSRNDFWEYDPSTNAWTEKTNFGGAPRRNAVGFFIGTNIDTKGYVGTGDDGAAYKKDFWEYDPSTNAWTKKADFGGEARSSAVGFSIDTKGYVGTGDDGAAYKKDFWEYDPSTNAWTKKANFGGAPRRNAVGFSIGTKGYVGTGYDDAGISKKDFWEYDPSTNAWTKKADFGGSARYHAVGFSIGTKGYVGTGKDIGGRKKDFWEFCP